VTREELTIKINEIKSRPTMNTWASGFCESLLEQLGNGRKLTERQLVVFEKIVKQNSLEEVEILKGWSAEYQEKYKDHAVLLAKYYAASGYYLQLASDILAGNLPSRHTFLKMYSNKYAKKVVTESHRQARFKSGSHVMANSQCSHKRMRDCNRHELIEYKLFHIFKRSGGIIIEIDHGTILSAANGAKLYKILPIGAVQPFWIEERFVKKGKAKKKKIA
jgi:hypothetical protein